jgi:acyl phosphate:glycerol-3-phosphate acyltransferase
MIQVQVVLILLSYLLGAIPFGYILTKNRTGLNILEHGSGNIGSTNVRRVAGKKLALEVQILDMLKGLVPVSFVLLLIQMGFYIFPDYFIFLVASSSIIGHNFSIFLHFMGGKGVNTTLGATVMLAPIEVFCAVGAYFLVKKLLKYTSAGSIALALTLPITGLILHVEKWLFIYLLFCSLMILLRHTSNIRRLFSGKEI